MFEDLVREHLDALWSAALRFADGREADAEDLLQDSLLRAYQGFADLRDPQAGRSWLFTILSRTYLNRVRAQQRRRETLAGDLDEPEFEEALANWKPSETPEQVFSHESLRDRLVAALDGLAPEVRTVVWLSCVEGFKQREVAEMLEVPAGTVASRLHRGRQRLRDALAGSERERNRRKSS